MDDGLGLFAAERKGNKSKGLKDFRPTARTSQDQNLVLTVVFVPNSSESGPDSLIRAEFARLRTRVTCAEELEAL